MADRPSRLANLKELIGLVSLSAQVQREISDILSDYEVQIYGLQEDVKRLTAAVRKQDDIINSLTRLYNGVMNRLDELK